MSSSLHQKDECYVAGLKIQMPLQYASSVISFDDEEKGIFTHSGMTLL